MTFLARSTPTVLNFNMLGALCWVLTPHHGALARREQEQTKPSIENAFAHMKALLRKAAEQTVEGLWKIIGRIVDMFTPTQCANYFKAAGYASK